MQNPFNPWHGIPPRTKDNTIVKCLIEIPKGSKVKYELDKETGMLIMDRVLFSSVMYPANYGFIPRTLDGDGDPLDICVISERPIARAEVILHARVVGGLPMIDRGEADDKIIAVLETDNMWAHVNDISELPAVLVDRIYHYFSTYKIIPGQEVEVHIDRPYGREHAEKVVTASISDYLEHFGG